MNPSVYEARRQNPRTESEEISNKLPATTQTTGKKN